MTVHFNEQIEDGTTVSRSELLLLHSDEHRWGRLFRHPGHRACLASAEHRHLGVDSATQDPRSSPRRRHHRRRHHRQRYLHLAEGRSARVGIRRRVASLYGRCVGSSRWSSHVLRRVGDYAYIRESLGPLLGFLYILVALIVIIPTGNSVTSLTFAYYILQPIFPTCDPNDVGVRLLAALAVDQCVVNVFCFVIFILKPVSLKMLMMMLLFHFDSLTHCHELFECELGQTGTGGLHCHQDHCSRHHHRHRHRSAVLRWIDRLPIVWKPFNLVNRVIQILMSL